jgi:hypothetical protein
VISDAEALFREAAQQEAAAHRGPLAGHPRQRYLADAYRLRQMLLNLVNNAIKFTERGEVRRGARGAARGRAAEGTVWLEFSVTDTGIGITPEQLQGLFEPFTQADSSTTRRYGGTGLGLSIVSSLARLQSGQFGADSRPGEGSRFWFRCRSPTADQRPAAASSPTGGWDASPLTGVNGRATASRPSAGGRGSGGQPRLPGDAGRLGLSVTLADGGEAAVAAFSAGEPFDCVLMDIRMPAMDGMEAMRRIRRWEVDQHHLLPHPIAVTANAGDDDRVLPRCRSR